MTTLLLALLACLAILCETSLGAVGLTVNIIVLQSATAQGAVCLDGSPPAYYIDRGSDTGLSKWIVYLQGGGWCESISACINRTSHSLGSSKHMNNQIEFGGILHNSPQENPDFYNWNRVLVNYCDGSSFTGDVEQVNPISRTRDKLYFRGARIFKVVLEGLWSKGMQNAENAILSGSSAGGLATILNCDKFKSSFPSDFVKVKCVANAGFFLNINTAAGTPYIRNTYQKVVDLHPVFFLLSTRGFGVAFLKTFLGLPPCYTRGYFITSCRAHADIIWDKYWYGNVSIHNKTIGEAVGAWYFDRTGFHQHMDPEPFARDC